MKRERKLSAHEAAVTINDGPCSEFRHAGERCRVRWASCLGAGASAPAHPWTGPKRHDADSTAERNIGRVYQDATNHLRVIW